MEMRQVEYFRALAEELNFTRAAKRCGVSQPSLTRSIRLLEQEFGGELFHREGARNRLSELGHIIKPHLDQMFDQAHAAVTQARTFWDSQVVSLKLGVMCTVAPADLVQLLTGVRARHPDVQLEVVDADPATLERRLREGELDAAIVGGSEAERVPEGLHYLPLYREQFVIVIGHDHRLSRLESIRCRDLNAEAYLRRSNCELAEATAASFHEQGVQIKTVYRSDRDDWILAMSAAGMGFAFMPRRSVNHPEVRAAPLIDPEVWRLVHLVTVRGRAHSPAVGALVHEAMRAAWREDRALAVPPAHLAPLNEA